MSVDKSKRTGSRQPARNRDVELYIEVDAETVQALASLRSADEAVLLLPPRRVRLQVPARAG